MTVPILLYPKPKTNRCVSTSRSVPSGFIIQFDCLVHFKICPLAQTTFCAATSRSVPSGIKIQLDWLCMCLSSPSTCLVFSRPKACLVHFEMHLVEYSRVWWNLQFYFSNCWASLIAHNCRSVRSGTIVQMRSLWTVFLLSFRLSDPMLSWLAIKFLHSAGYFKGANLSFFGLSILSPLDHLMCNYLPFGTVALPFVLSIASA